METKDEFPTRKRNRLQNFNYSSSKAYFITICTKNRKNLFWARKQPDFVGEDIILPPDHVNLSPHGIIVDEAINNIPKHYPEIQLLQYVIMPNHVHIILLIPYDDGRIISSPTSILTVIGQMKRYASRKTGEAIWQKSFYDHLIRNANDYEDICKYIYENPIKWQYDTYYSED